MKLTDALLVLAMIESAKDEIAVLKPGEKLQLPSGVHFKSHGRRYRVRLVVELEPES